MATASMGFVMRQHSAALSDRFNQVHEEQMEILHRVFQKGQNPESVSSTIEELRNEMLATQKRLVQRLLTDVSDMVPGISPLENPGDLGSDRIETAGLAALGSKVMEFPSGKVVGELEEAPVAKEARYRHYRAFLMDNEGTLGTNYGSRRHGEMEILTDSKDIAAAEEFLSKKYGMPIQLGKIYENPWYTWVLDPVRSGPGQGVYGMYGRFIPNAFLRGNMGAVGIPELPDGRVVMVVQKRHTERAGKLLLELPRGGGEAGEAVLATLRRELSAETGAQLKSSGEIPLGNIRPDSGCMVGALPAYKVMVEGLEGELQRDPEEHGMEVVVLTRAQIQEATKDGAIELELSDGKRVVYFEDGFSLAAFAQMWARDPSSMS